MNGGKKVVSHQAQHQINDPILFGSLTNDLLSKGMKHDKTTLPAVDACSSSHLNSAKEYNFSTLNSLLHAHAEEHSIGCLPHADFAPRSMKQLSKSASGLERPVDPAVCLLPKGSLQPHGVARLAGQLAPGGSLLTPSPRSPRPGVLPLTSGRHQLPTLQAFAAAPLVGSAPVGATGEVAASHC
jgi:hypothetical protein